MTYQEEDFTGSPILEGIREQVQIFGEEKSDQAWISTSWDTWEANPYYRGAKAPHPEDDTICAVEYAEYLKQEGIKGKNPCGCRCEQCDPVAYKEDRAEYEAWEQSDERKALYAGDYDPIPF